MRYNAVVKSFLPKSVLSRLGRTRAALARGPRPGNVGSGIGQFAFDKNLDIKGDIQRKYGFDGDLLDLFIEHRERILHKWHHYIPIYDRYLSRFRGHGVKFLEIGVAGGGSLEMWRDYFGNEAVIYGIDIDPDCQEFNGLAGQVRIGSQDDAKFLETVVKEMGGVDVVLDDGSHRMDHVLSSFTFLFPKLSDGGIYMIEDLHTAYWRGFGGGFRSKSNFFRFVAELIDDMHHWYHRNGLRHPVISNVCSGIHVHDSIVMLEKNKVHKPTHS